MKINLLKLLIVWAGLSLGPVSAQTDSLPVRHAFTLKQAIDYAKKNNVNVASLT